MPWRGIENLDSFNLNKENQDIYDSFLQLKGFLHMGMILDLLIDLWTVKDRRQVGGWQRLNNFSSIKETFLVVKK